MSHRDLLPAVVGHTGTTGSRLLAKPPRNEGGGGGSFRKIQDDFENIIANGSRPPRPIALMNQSVAALSPANTNTNTTSGVTPETASASSEVELDDKLQFPELQQAGIDEKALRASPFGKVLFTVLDALFPVFKEPNWFDVYDPPLTTAENLELPYFDGYDFVNSSWTFYVRTRYGAWNWLDRLGLVPLATQRVFLREDGKTVWSDGYYGDWYINPAINYLQIEKHYARGYGASQSARGIRIFQIQRWNFEPEVGRYWNRGLRSYLRNETNYWAFEGRVWGAAVRWRPYPRDQGKFIAIRDGTNLTAVFGDERNTPWEERFRHAMSLPFYQAHPDQLERIEDNFDIFYRNFLNEEVR